MHVSEDGTVVGSIDVSKLDEIEPKTDEAKAQLEALKAEVASGQPAADTEPEAKQEAPKPAPAKSAPAKSAQWRSRRRAATRGRPWPSLASVRTTSAGTCRRRR